jgi:hypothetical protein
LRHAPVTEFKTLSRFSAAMLAYSALAILAIVTLDAKLHVMGREVPLSAVTLLVLALFAFRAWIHRKREMLETNRNG